MTEAADVLKTINRQLAWRGPTGKSMGHVVLPRDHAEYLQRLLQRVKGGDQLELGEPER